jgi:pyridoxine 5'-phosphate synthase PdxJ
MSQAHDILLGVNIDHIATLRQARGTRYPDPVHAAVPIPLRCICVKIAAIFRSAMCGR